MDFLYGRRRDRRFPEGEKQTQTEEDIPVPPTPDARGSTTGSRNVSGPCIIYEDSQTTYVLRCRNRFGFTLTLLFHSDSTVPSLRRHSPLSRTPFRSGCPPLHGDRKDWEGIGRGMTQSGSETVHVTVVVPLPNPGCRVSSVWFVCRGRDSVQEMKGLHYRFPSLLPLFSFCLSRSLLLLHSSPPVIW